MPQEHAELMRRALEAWNRNDWATLQRCHDPDVTVVAPAGWPEASGARGWEETRQQYERLKDSWEFERNEIDEILVIGEQVLARFRWIASGRASGAEQELPMANVATVRDGRFVEIQYFLDPAEALEAAGLSDSATSEENVELSRRVFDAMNRRDLNGFLSLMDENVEAVSRIVAMEGGLHGHEGIRLWWENWFGAFPDYNVEVVEMRGVGDAVLASVRAVGHGAGSDLPFEDAVWPVSRWRDGRCVWWQVCYTRHEALEAAGVRE